MIAYVYAMITQQSGRVRYVKFGMASDVARRRMEVQCGCPFRIEKILYVECQNPQQASLLEACLHREHATCRASGEWFKFDPGQAEVDARLALVLIAEREGVTPTVASLGAAIPREVPLKLGFMPTIGRTDLSRINVVKKNRKTLKSNG